MRAQQFQVTVTPDHKGSHEISMVLNRSQYAAWLLTQRAAGGAIFNNGATRFHGCTGTIDWRSRAKF